MFTNFQLKRATLLRALIGLPILTYALSYAYLCWYHGLLVRPDTIVHESGKHSFFETTFFASHFLGHIPVHVVVAFAFVGTYCCLRPPAPGTDSPNTVRILVSLLAVFLVFSVLLSLWLFGAEDTVAYLLQRRQRVGELTAGGSWNLHLPSTLLMFLLVPPYIFCILRLGAYEVRYSRAGLLYVAWAVGICLGMTVAVNYSNLFQLSEILVDARYQGHSVRELATFPLTYLPLPLGWILLGAAQSPRNRLGDGSGGKTHAVIYACGVLFLLVFAYQVVLTLSVGVENVAHRPSFARDGELGIGYLLASHYFEHFLDTIFFTLFAVILSELHRRKLNH